MTDTSHIAYRVSFLPTGELCYFGLQSTAEAYARANCGTVEEVVMQKAHRSFEVVDTELPHVFTMRNRNTEIVKLQCALDEAITECNVLKAENANLLADIAHHYGPRYKVPPRPEGQLSPFEIEARVRGAQDMKDAIIAEIDRLISLVTNPVEWPANHLYENYLHAYKTVRHAVLTRKVQQ